jgi:hypothetical protein
MYLKITDGKAGQFPYTIGDFRRDNPHTSFPLIISKSLLYNYGICPVTPEAYPEFNSMVQSLVRNANPHKEVLTRQIKDEANEGEFLSESYETGFWKIGYTIVNKPQDQSEAAIRDKRNRMLSDTDWMALSDSTLATVWATYRQALRDITGQAIFPYAVTWPTKPE